MSLVRCLKSSVSSNILRRQSLAGGVASARAFHVTPARAVVYPNADHKTFKQVTSAKDRITLVDFHADWCGPCHQLAPVIQKLTDEPNKSGKTGLPLDLVKVDTDSDEGQLLGATYKVRALPTVIAFRDGAPISQFVGALNAAGVQKFLDDL
ncbi:thioredoxin-like protein [Pholiota conissans]|uniref:Thioredoxin-like protein n=1 Tax=Pholiota conissans TaxID=109636 RepID=A0A9P5ZCK3_9AGAR|nr:thioredoxin-like protein [Pholiota conissans]